MPILRLIPFLILEHKDILYGRHTHVNKKIHLNGTNFSVAVSIFKLRKKCYDKGGFLMNDIFL